MGVWASCCVPAAGKASASLDGLPQPLPAPKIVAVYGTSVVVQIPPFSGRVSFEVSEYSFVRYSWRGVNADLVKMKSPGKYSVEGLLYDSNYCVKATYHGDRVQVSTPPSEFVETLNRVDHEKKLQQEFYQSFTLSRKALDDELTEYVCCIIAACFLLL
jgi:hypothetical protein